jgi:type IV pilus assembly protein PilC
VFWEMLMSLYKQLKERRRITHLDMAVFLRQFATLIAAGIPIIKTCDILEKNQVKRSCRILIYSIKREILKGNSLFFSLQKYSAHFDSLTCALIQIGENTGRLDEMLLKIASHWEKNLLLKKRIWQALFYPCLITIASIIVTVIMLLFVVPRFAELFADHYTELPLLTQCIFMLANVLHYHLLILAILLIPLIFMLKKFSKHYKPYLQQFTGHLPIIKNYRHKILLTQFARNLAITFASGITIMEALKLIAQIDKRLSAVTAELRIKINSGLPLNQAMEGNTLFPLLMIQMIRVGEESGKLDDMLNTIADFLDTEIEQFIHLFSQLLEPLIMLVLGVLIGGLVISLYLPIFKLGTQL